jgi:hypothetical protein
VKKFQTRKIRMGRVNLVADKQLESRCKGCEIIHREVECGRELVARRAQVEILTKCQRKCSEE